ncbi:hypothetical protein BAX97_13370 [Elizabethkingia meningoseptica]|uniref:hypothetical protein n=1 Tax=Elizabethkingia meningoseptica TaxID=238 RepID=UPI000999C173|nr:hypothetical protein [Elizabethkingia meningoseptica]OPC32257.1 hypothetical protein BAX97_13370 [Elizabethkingia meningoseptica]
MKKIIFFNIMALLFLISCSREEESFYAEQEAVVPNTGKKIDILPDYLTDKGTINISMVATGNYTGIYDSRFLKDITGGNSSYCHPDVLYFPQGFNGYKYWMVFTPYFGAVGMTHESIRFENPTVVVSNDGINWTAPMGIKNPLQCTPSPQESIIEKKGQTKQGYWSDVDWVYVNNKFYLYYRGSAITAKALKDRGAKSQNNRVKLQKNASRNIMQQTSTDGIHWTPMEAVINSNKPYTPDDNILVSPSMIHNGSQFISYEVDNNTGKKNFKGNDPSYIIKRTSVDGLNFSTFTRSKIVNFATKPWLDVDPGYAPWHIQAAYVDGYYFLCIAIGYVKSSTAEALYMAYSKDGTNFVVFPKPMVEKNAYRSAVFPMNSDNETIRMGAVIGLKSGVFKYREFTLNKEKLDKGLEAK